MLVPVGFALHGRLCSPRNHANFILETLGDTAAHGPSDLAALLSYVCLDIVATLRAITIECVARSLPIGKIRLSAHVEPIRPKRKSVLQHIDTTKALFTNSAKMRLRSTVHCRSRAPNLLHLRPSNDLCLGHSLDHCHSRLCRQLCLQGHPESREIARLCFGVR